MVRKWNWFWSYWTLLQGVLWYQFINLVFIAALQGWMMAWKPVSSHLVTLLLGLSRLRPEFPTRNIHLYLPTRLTPHNEFVIAVTTKFFQIHHPKNHRILGAWQRQSYIGKDFLIQSLLFSSVPSSSLLPPSSLFCNCGREERWYRFLKARWEYHNHLYRISDETKCTSE